MNKLSNTITVPRVKSFESYKEYLKEFWASNQNLSFFSSRYLASKLSWSSSYFHDVLGGRKKLTIQRAFEFSHFFKFKEDEVEYLIWLVINDFDHALAVEFSKTQIAKNKNL